VFSASAVAALQVIKIISHAHDLGENNSNLIHPIDGQVQFGVQLGLYYIGSRVKKVLTTTPLDARISAMASAKCAHMR
jgi:hypothetical protein